MIYSYNCIISQSLLVAAGIRCDDRNNDVLPPYIRLKQFTTPPTTVCIYNIEPKRQNNYHPTLSAYPTFVVITTYNHRCIYKIYNPKPHTVYKHIFALYVSQNVTAHAQSTSTTHFSYSSKCRRTSLYKTYHRVFDSLNQKARVRAITFAPPYINSIKYTTPPTTLIT